MRKIHVHTAWQSNYDYTCSEPIGENFDDDFKPELTRTEKQKIASKFLGVDGTKVNNSTLLKLYLKSKSDNESIN